MNNLYHWHDEVMVDLEMREIQREIANANLLREAGLAGNDWLRRAVHGFLNLFKRKVGESQEHRSTERQSYRSRREKAA